jgi:hypothetical protein
MWRDLLEPVEVELVVLGVEDQPTFEGSAKELRDVMKVVTEPTEPQRMRSQHSDSAIVGISCLE